MGVTVHRVIEQVDAGEVLDQKVAVSPSEVEKLTLEEVEYQVHKLEHQMVRRVAAGWKI